MDLDQITKLTQNDTVRRLLQSVLAYAGDSGLDLNRLLDHLQQGGLQQQIQSWVDTGANKPVSGQQVRDALGAETLDAAAAQAGTSPDDAAEKLADVLPRLVDSASPSGALPDASSLQDAMSQILRPNPAL